MLVCCVSNRPDPIVVGVIVISPAAFLNSIDPYRALTSANAEVSVTRKFVRMSTSTLPPEAAPEDTAATATLAADGSAVQAAVESAASDVSAAVAVEDAPAATPEPAVAAPTNSRKTGGSAGWILRAGGAGTLLVCVIGGVAWYATLPAGPTRDQQFETALKHIDQRKYLEAREIAKDLEAARYKPPGFDGGIEFILGMAAYQMAETSEDVSQRQQYIAAMTYLREADRRAVAPDRHLQWSFALGSSLYHIGELTKARQFLELARERYQPGEIEAAEMLTDIYLDPSQGNDSLRQEALVLNDQVLAANSESAKRRDVALLRRAEILLALNSTAEALNALKEISVANAKNPAKAVLEARIALAERKYEDAITKLTPVVQDERLDRTYPRQAAYLSAIARDALATSLAAKAAQDPSVAEEAKNERIRVINQYLALAARYERSQEAVAANIRVGKMLQEDTSDEKALQAYGTALRMVRRPSEFHNRWLSLEEFRGRILDAWNSWIAVKKYSDAIALADMMTPLFSQDEAFELSARAHKHRAENFVAETKGERQTVLAQRQIQQRQLWRESALAYSQLAEARRTAANYPEALWTSAEHYQLGYDFPRALEQLNRYLETQPVGSLAVPLVRRAQLRLDMDQPELAEQDLQRVIEGFPHDPLVFTARYLQGISLLEQNKWEQAEGTWRALLGWDALSPSAIEWRDTQLALGRLLYETGSMIWREAETRKGGQSAEAVAKQHDAASQRWQESIRRLEEFALRYPQAAGAIEARYFLAKALQAQATWQKQKHAAAETDNARQQWKRNFEASLNRALFEFKSLRDELQSALQQDRLDDYEKGILRNCSFETAHTLAMLDQYEEAISAYSNAASRYPQDAQVLTAYLRMAHCYSKLGREVERRSMIEQADVILKHKQIPDSAFVAASTSLTAAEWSAWLNRARQLQR